MSGLKNITVEINSNGYKAEGIQSMIRKFEKAAAQIFPGCTVRHFYYSDSIDMIDIVLESGQCAKFSVTANRVSLCGYTRRIGVLEKFSVMTYNDERYNGKLLEIAAKEERVGEEGIN